jgi:hypothetical protein
VNVYNNRDNDDEYKKDKDNSSITTITTDNEESLECLCRLLTTVGQVGFAPQQIVFAALTNHVFARCSSRIRPSA